MRDLVKLVAQAATMVLGIWVAAVLLGIAAGRW